MRIFKRKIGIDLLMTVLLLLLMAYQVVGESLHEWFGTGMLILFVTHNLLNARWYGSLLKGKYRLARIFRTAVNLTLFISMLCMAYSGIVMSRHVFAFLPIENGMALARVMHLAGSYWSFVLMSLHLGLHWAMVTGMLQRAYGGRNPAVYTWALRLIAVMIAGYGAICFWRENCLSYMLLKTEFAFFDYEKSPVTVFAEYIAMMGFWVFVAYYILKILGKRSEAKGRSFIMKKTLVAYFSASGTTQRLARTLASAVGADLHEIQPKRAYTSADLNWNDKNSRSSMEMNDKSSRPEIANSVEHPEQYDTIFVGFPIWWYVAPTIINTFLEQYDLTGKTVVPFATSGGSGMGKTNEALKPSCSGAILKAGRRFLPSAGEKELKEWAAELGI